jgi:hypothetical protein
VRGEIQVSLTLSGSCRTADDSQRTYQVQDVRDASQASEHCHKTHGLHCKRLVGCVCRAPATPPRIASARRAAVYKPPQCITRCQSTNELCTD